MNLFAYFEIGRSALNASQTALQVAGNNIANVNTPGYSRRRVELTTTLPQRVPGGYIGQGVNVQALHRVRDLFLSGQIQSGLSNVGGLEERARTLTGLEAVLGPLEGAPIADALDALGLALSDVADQPENRGVRQVAVSAAERLAGSLRSAYEQISKARQGSDAAIAQTASQVNELSASIAGLNRSIKELEGTGQEASDLRDQRDLALGRLAELVDINVISSNDGSVGVALTGGGETLVVGDSSFALVTEPDPVSPGLSRLVLDIPGNRSIVTDKISGGRLGGLLASRDTVLAAAQADLDTVAADLVARFNTAHAGGFTAAGATGGAFFTVSAAPGASAAASIRVDAGLAADASLLAAGTTATPGDGLNAAALADLIGSPSAALGNTSPRSYYSNLLSRVGADLAGTDTRLAAESQFVAGLQSLSDSVSGVSLDEEAVSLIQYQRSYEASARFIQVLDEVTQIAVNLGAR